MGPGPDHRLGIADGDPGRRRIFARVPRQGSGGGSFNNLPGAGSGILSGRLGASVTRAPTSITTPGAAGSPAAGMGIRPIAVLPENPLPNYGPLSIPAGGEDEGPADGLDLNQLVDRVIQSNIELRAKFFEIPQAQADILTASLRANPVFYADSQLIPYSQYSRQRPGGPTQYDINISIPLDVNRKRIARIAVATRAKKVLEALFQDAIRNQVDNLYTAYVDVLAARLTVDYARASLKGLDDALGFTENKFKQGTIVEAQVLQVRVPREFAAASVADAEAAYKRSLQTLAMLLAVPPQEAGDLKIKGSIKERVPQEFSEEGLAKLALTIRPDVLANRLGVQRAVADIELAKRNRFADVYLLAQPYTFQDNAPFGTKSAHSAAFGVTVPLPLINRNQGNIQRAKLNADQTRLELTSVERQAYLDVQQALVEYQASLEGVRRAERSRADAESVFQSTEKLYRAGQVDVLVYLASRREYNETVRQFRDVNVRHRRSMLNLNTAVGQRILE